MRRLLALFALAMLGSAARAEPRPLRLMTYNLNYANPDRAATLDAIAAIDADVVLLQEVHGAWQQALLARFATQYPHRVLRVDQDRAAGGLAVLSKREITSEEVFASPVSGWFRAERLVIDAPFGALQILHVHLRPAVDRGSWVRGFLTTPAMRRREIEAYWPHVAPDVPTIAAGDFNEDATGRAIAFLVDQGLSRAATEGPPTWHYATKIRGRLVDALRLDIDHVMLDKSLVARDGHVLDAGTSDHRPVVVTIERR